MAGIYDDLINEVPTTDQVAKEIEGNVFVNKDTNPDRRAEAIKIANQYKTSVDFVEKNFDSFKEESEKKDAGFYDDLVKNYPTSSEILADPTNAGLVKDDMDSLKKIEGAFKSKSWFDKSIDSLAHGSLKGIGGLADFTKMKDKEYEEFYSGLPEKLRPTMGLLTKDQYAEIKNWSEEKSKQFENPETQRSFITEFSNGNLGNAFESLSLQILESVPQLAVTAMNAPAGLSLMFASSSGSKYDENIKAGIEEEKARRNAYMTGAIETGVESLFGIGKINPLKQTIKEAEKTFGKQTTGAILKRTTKEILKTSGGEGFEETVTELGQSFLDWGTDINPNALDGVLLRSADAFIVGAGSGGLVGIPMSAGDFSRRYSEVQKANAASSVVDKLESAAKESKIRQRSPEKFEEFAQKNAVGSGIENIYLDTQDVQEFFQKNEELGSAEDYMSKIGILEEWNKAVEQGRDIVLPTGQFINRFMDETWFKDFKDLARFNPEDISQKEIKKQNSEMKEAIKQEYDRRLDLEQQGQDIIDDVEKQIREQFPDITPKYAKYMASIYTVIPQLAAREGVEPQEIYKRYGLKIRNVETPVSTENQEYFQKNNLGFYSRLEKTVADKMPNQTGVDQLKGILKEIKPEEMEWLGLNDFLKGKDKVKKEDVLNFLRGSQLNIEEVTIGTVINKDTPKTGDTVYMVFSEDGEGGDAFQKRENAEADAELNGGEVQEIEWDGETTLVDVEYDIEGAPTKYSQYTLPGGENYREVLMTLPETETNYKSSHFNQKNILAHTRLTDRVDADGKKVLFVEEIQSDWHQAGRKKGYKDSSLKQMNFQEWMKNKYPDLENIEEISRKKFNNKEDQDFVEYRKNQDAANINARAVPNAPFKKTWHEFVFKRILTMAVEQGYDRVSWTTGEQQAERFDLSKSIDRIILSDNSKLPDQYGNKKGYKLVATDKQGNLIIDKNVEDQSELSDYIGKEAAEKILKPEYKDKKYKSGAVHILENADLKVGGEGMKGFYDKILVDYANKLGKKFGAKVQDSNIDKNQVHSLEITPQLKSIVETQGFELFQDAKGRFTIDKNRQATIELFKGKDLSTFLHESAHFFLEVTFDQSQEANASQGLKDDVQEIFKYLGITDRSQIKSEHHEKFARAFETYLMEGKTPNSNLKKAFNSFKVWLTDIYKSISGIEQAAGQEIKLSDEMREVFDRLTYAEAAIERTEAELNMNRMKGDDLPKGYSEALEQARIDAEAILNKKAIEDFNKKQTKEYKQKLANRIEEIKKDLLNDPVYKALELLKTTPDIKLDKDSVIQVFGKEIANKLPKSVYSKDGVHFEIASEFLGFEDAKEFVDKASKLKPLEEAAKDQAESEIEKPNMAEDAKAAVHNESRAKVLELELDYLIDKNNSVYKDAVKKIVKRASYSAEVKKQAQDIIGKEKVSQVKPNLFLRAEVKASKEAGKALVKGDIRKAFEYKRQELLNHYLYKMSIEANQKIDKKIKSYRKMFKKNQDTSKTRDMDYVNTARAILTGYGIMSSTRVEDPISYLKKTREYDPERFASVSNLLDDAKNGMDNYDNITVDKLNSVFDIVDAIWDLSKELRQITIDGKSVLIEDAVNEINKELKKHKDKSGKTIELKGSLSDQEKRSAKFLGAFTSLKIVQNWADYIDLGNPNGFMKKYIWYPISEAAAKYRVETKKTTEQYKQIVEKYKDIFDNKKVYDGTELNSEGVKFSFTKNEILMMLLHSGNMSNKSKLLRGGRNYKGETYAMGYLNEDGSLNSIEFDNMFKRWRSDGTLTKKDYDFAQEIWDLFESIKPELQKAHKKTEGFYFSEITADAVETEFGTYKGGYLPAKVDHYVDEKAALRKEREEAENNNSSYAFPTVSKGSTMSRVESYAAPLSLEFNLLGTHLDWTMKFIHLRPAVKDVTKIVLNTDFRKNLSAVDEKAGSEMLVPWLQRTAEQKLIVPTDAKLLDTMARELRRRFSLQVLALSLTNGLQNFGSIVVSSSKINPKYLIRSSFDLIKNRNETLEFIANSSNFMKAEMDDFSRKALMDANSVIVNESKLEKASNFLKEYSGILDNMSTSYVKSHIWFSQYNQSIDQGLGHKQAVRMADDVVKNVTSVLNAEDVARILTGSESKLFFMQFMGYFNRLNNFRGFELAKIHKQFGLTKTEGMKRALPMIMLSALLPAAYSAVISKLVAGRLGEDEDKDGYLDEVLSVFFGSFFKETLAGVPFGQLALGVERSFNKNPMDDKLTLAPAISLIDTSIQLPKKLIEAASKEELGKQTVKDTLTVIGAITNLPVGFLGKPTGYLMDLESGRAKPTGPIDLTRGLISGQAGSK